MPLVTLTSLAFPLPSQGLSVRRSVCTGLCFVKLWSLLWSPDALRREFHNEIIDFCSTLVLRRMVHKQQADMMCLVADVRELRKPQSWACVTTALETKHATGYLWCCRAECGKRNQGASLSSPRALLLPWELKGRNSHLNLHFVPDTRQQEITNLREDAVSSYLQLLA